MRENRFFGDFDFSQQKTTIRDKQICKQLHTVLRSKKGDQITLCDNKGTCFQVTIQTIEKEKIECSLGKQIESNKSQEKVSLFCSILKKENFEWVVQKTTELGVSRIVPLITKRTVKRGIDKKRLEKIAKEAAEQSGRFDIPTIEEVTTLEKVLQEKTECQKILCNMDGKTIRKEDIKGDVEIFIGPEGGWDQREIEMAEKNGCSIVSFSSLTLRAETAAIVATYQMIRYTNKK